MKTFPVLIALSLSLVAAPTLHADPAPAAGKTEKAEKAPAPAAIQAAFNKIWKAIVDNDQPAFIAGGDADFRAAGTAQVVKQVHDVVTPRVAKGMTVIYLGDMKAKGYRVDLWKLSFNDGGDDWLASMSTKDGLVGGFFFS